MTTTNMPYIIYYPGLYFYYMEETSHAYHESTSSCHDPQKESHTYAAPSESYNNARHITTSTDNILFVRKKRSHIGARCVVWLHLIFHLYHTVCCDGRMQHLHCSRTAKCNISQTDNTYGSQRQRKFYSGGISGKYSFCLPFVALTCHRKPPLEQNGAFQCGKHNTGFYRHEILETHSQLRSLHTLTHSELNAKDISLRLSISSISSSDTSTRTPLHPTQTNPQTYQALSSTD